MVLLLSVMVFPRVALVLLYLASDVIQRAYDGLVVPALGLIFLPVTTAAYAWIVDTHRSLSGPYLGVMVFALLVDGATWSAATRPKTGR
jgi:hypothetical protein